MQFEVHKNIILKAISDTIGAVEKKNTIPVLQNIKIAVADDKVVLSATDMDILITSSFDCDMKNSGSTTVPAQMFFDIIRKIPDGLILIKLDNSLILQIKSGKSKYNLTCIDPSEFPALAETEMSNQISIDPLKLIKMIDKTRFAISNDESRYYLNGLFLQFYMQDDIKEIRTVATDGHRLALSFMDSDFAESSSVIIPKKSVNEIRRIIDGVKNVSINLSRTKIKIVADRTTIISKLIDGEFPDYQKVLPKNNTQIALIDRKNLFDCVDRVATVASDKHRSVKLIFETGKVSLQVGLDENPLAFEEMDINYSGEKIETGYNAKYLLDIIAQIDKEQIILKLKDSMSPTLIEAQDMSSIFVIMPVRV
jgi:DNA polymerase-3 subunit beta